jgi:predicted RNA binding protein YcfA (HicA-like mRNA interferase family)
MKPKALLARLARGELANVAFSDVQRLAEALGFTLDRVAGSHHIYRHPDVTERLNLQPSRSGDAKPYQLRQLLQLAERHALNLPEEKP